VMFFRVPVGAFLRRDVGTEAGRGREVMRGAEGRRGEGSDDGLFSDGVVYVLSKSRDEGETTGYGTTVVIGLRVEPRSRASRVRWLGVVVGSFILRAVGPSELSEGEWRRLAPGDAKRLYADGMRDDNLDSCPYLGGWEL